MFSEAHCTMYSETYIDCSSTWKSPKDCEHKTKIKSSLLVASTDYYSKWPQLAFSPSATTNDVVQLLSSVFSRHSNPENINVTDKSTQFTSEAFDSFLHNTGNSHSRTSVYCPAANGAIERFLRDLCTCIQTAIQPSQPWKQASSLWDNTACNHFLLSLWTDVWQKDGYLTRQTLFAFCLL